MNVSEKYDYIVGAITSFEAKIRLLNKQGFFDESKLFETLVKEVAQRVLNQEFINLNDFSSTFPGVDLRSENGDIDIQISTTDQINAKVSHTFEVIKRKNLSIRKIIFIFLSHDTFTSKKTYPEYFIPSKHILNIKKFLDLIKGNINFINEIYNVFVKFFESGGFVNYFYKILDDSEFYLKNNIVSTIGDTLSINRSIEINKNARHLMITGEAGFGKSVQAKTLVDGLPTIFVRAERFVEKSIDDIWGFDILKAFNYLSDKKITVLIDSLESLSDVHKDDLLQLFMHKISGIGNISVIFTCRSSEVSKFTKLISDNHIEVVEIGLLNKDEMKQVFAALPKLRNINETSSLYIVIRNPFYLNLLVTHSVDYGQISDANEFREHIWKNIIADTTGKRDAFTKIVVDRAINFSLYVPRNNYLKEAVDKLISDGILIERNNQVRSKYDIFEDICFERIIDDLFEQAKSDFSKFFNNIETLGKCVYRRYQIWVANKLWDKENQQKFISSIVFSKSDEKWTKQTIIGIIKSRKADSFIEKNMEVFNDPVILDSFVSLMNLYGFTIEFDLFTSQIQLKPRIHGRIGLLLAIYKYELYKKPNQFSKVLNFLKSNNKIGFAEDDKLRIVSFKIVNHMASAVLEEIVEKESRGNEYLTDFFGTLFLYSKDHGNEIQKHFNEFLLLYDMEGRHEERIGKVLIEKCLDGSCYALVAFHPELLCDLAFEYWTRPEKDKGPFHRSYYGDDLRGLKKYGLNENADDYKHHRKVFTEVYFFNFLFLLHFEVGVRFAIKLINYCIASLNVNEPEQVFEAKVFFGDGGEKTYYANEDLWLAYRGFTVMPNVIIALLKNLEYAVLQHVKAREKKEDRLAFANEFKNRVFRESNNITIFPIILSIGQEYLEDLGNYALDLASNLFFIYADIDRFVAEKSGGFYEIGLFSDHQKRVLRAHNNQGFRKQIIQEYVMKLQTMGFHDECLKLLDRHYSLLDKTEDNANALLQIEKMDMRKAAIKKIPEGLLIYPGYSLSPIAEAIVKRNHDDTKIQNNDSILLDKIKDDIRNKTYDFASTLGELKKIIGNSGKYQISALYDHTICDFFYELIGEPEKMPIDDLNYILSYLLERIIPFLDHSGVGCPLASYDRIFKIKLSLMNGKNRNLLSKVIFLAFTNDHNGLASEIINSANRILKERQKLAIVNTLIIRSMEIRKYQILCYEHQHEDKLIPKPDMAPIINGMFGRPYVLPTIDQIDDMTYDVPSFIDVYKVKFDESTDWAKKTIKATTQYAFLMLSGKKKQRPGVFFWDFQYYLFGVMRKSADTAKWVIDLLVSQLTEDYLAHDVINFHDEIFADFTPVYYDAYNSRDIRKDIEDIIDYFENSLIDKFGVEGAKKFSNCFLLMFPRHIGDISKCPTEYSYNEKVFLSRKYLAYGTYEPEISIKNFYNLKINGLFPDLLPALDSIITDHLDINRNSDTRYILLRIIKYCYYENSNFNKIKNDVSLSDAFESILTKLISRLVQEAAIILDEFRIY